MYVPVPSELGKDESSELAADRGLLSKSDANLAVALSPDAESESAQLEQQTVVADVALG